MKSEALGSTVNWSNSEVSAPPSRWMMTLRTSKSDSCMVKGPRVVSLIKKTPAASSFSTIVTVDSSFG